MMKRQKGFTLLEVVVAIAIIGIVLTTALELLALGLRSAKTAGDYTEAVLLARRKLVELSLRKPRPETLAGTFEEGWRWRAEIKPYGEEAEDLPARLFTVRVRVFWPGRERKGVELVTLRMKVEEEKLPSIFPFPGRGGGR